MSKIIRTTKANWETSSENGEPITQEITIQYRGQSIAEIKQYMAEVDAKTKERPDEIFFPIVDSLVRRVHRIPELLKDKPPTVEWLEDQDVSNLNAIKDAIHANDNPEKK
jgi:hypothetical protein